MNFERLAALFFFVGVLIVAEITWGLPSDPPQPTPPRVPDWIEVTRLWQCSDLNALVRLRYVGDERHGSFVVECK